MLLRGGNCSLQLRLQHPHTLYDPTEKCMFSRYSLYSELSSLVFLKSIVVHGVDKECGV